jgi:hypothetical protein
LRAVGTSEEHYREFAKGPLSSYIHLIGEQDIPAAAKSIEDIGKKSPTVSDADALAFLESFHLRANVIATDAGAIKSVQSVLREIDSTKPLEIQTDPRQHLMPHIAAVAKMARMPTTPDAMTPRQQEAVYFNLDEEIRQTDYPLWRTKQVVDLLCGIWGQAYGQTYVEVIQPALTVRMWARDTVRLLLLLPIVWLARRR